VWNIPAGTLLRSFEGHTHHVLDVSLRYDGRVLVTTGADNSVKLWDIEAGGQRTANNQFSKFEVTSVAHVGVTDRFLVTTGEGLVRVLREDLVSEKAFDVPPPGTFLYSGAVTPDGGIVVTGGYDSLLRVRSGVDGKTIADLPPPAPGK
jgi:WD40 repeat protein